MNAPLKSGLEPLQETLERRKGFFPPIDDLQFPWKLLFNPHKNLTGPCGTQVFFGTGVLFYTVPVHVWHPHLRRTSILSPLSILIEV